MRGEGWVADRSIPIAPGSPLITVKVYGFRGNESLSESREKNRVLCLTKKSMLHFETAGSEQMKKA